MSATDYEIPSAEDLAWEADRLSLDQLEREQRGWFEAIADFLYRRWPQPDADVDDDGPVQAEYDEIEARLLAIAEALGWETTIADPDEEVGEGVAEMVKARLEHEREEGRKDALVPSRENAATKGRRLLIEGRLDVKRVVTEGDLAGLIVATCRGDSGEVYQLGFDPRPGQRKWRCTCPELRGNCSHLHALKLVTTIQAPE